MTELNQPKIHLNDFDGPLEMLLHLIQESKMDIYDIQISAITEQYMNYIYGAEKLNLTIIGDYFVMAAKLMVIKSKMLLPIDEEEQDDAEKSDPREALVAQLLNYRRYKKISEWLKLQDLKRRKSFTRSEMASTPTKSELIKPSPFRRGDIMASYIDALKHFKFNQPMSTVIHEWEFTVESQSSLVRKLLHRTTNSISFASVVKNSPKIEEIVTDFLAILEMAKYDEVHLTQPTFDQPITIEKGSKYHE